MINFALGFGAAIGIAILAPTFWGLILFNVADKFDDWFGRSIDEDDIQ